MKMEEKVSPISLYDVLTRNTTILIEWERLRTREYVGLRGGKPQETGKELHN